MRRNPINKRSQLFSSSGDCQTPRVVIEGMNVRPRQQFAKSRRHEEHVVFGTGQAVKKYDVGRGFHEEPYRLGEGIR